MAVPARQGSAGIDGAAGDTGSAVGGGTGDAGTSPASEAASGAATAAPQAGAAAPVGAAPGKPAANRGARGKPTPAAEPKSALNSFLQTLGFGDAGLDPKGAPLSREQERRAIEQHWQQPD